MRQYEIVVNEKGVHCKTPPLREDDNVRHDQTSFENKLLREMEELKKKLEELTKRVKELEKANAEVVDLTGDSSSDTVSVHSEDLSPVENGFFWLRLNCNFVNLAKQVVHIDYWNQI